ATGTPPRRHLARRRRRGFPNDTVFDITVHPGSWRSRASPPRSKSRGVRADRFKCMFCTWVGGENAEHTGTIQLFVKEIACLIPRELGVLRGLIRGASNKEIGRSLAPVR